MLLDKINALSRAVQLEAKKHQGSEMVFQVRTPTCLLFHILLDIDSYHGTGMARRKYKTSHRGFTAIPDGETKHRGGTGSSSLCLLFPSTLTPRSGQTTKTGRGRGTEDSQRPPVGRRIRGATTRGHHPATTLGTRTDTDQPPKGAV